MILKRKITKKETPRIVRTAESLNSVLLKMENWVEYKDEETGLLGYGNQPYFSLPNNKFDNNQRLSDPRSSFLASVYFDVRWNIFLNEGEIVCK